MLFLENVVLDWEFIHLVKNVVAFPCDWEDVRVFRVVVVPQSEVHVGLPLTTYEANSQGPVVKKSLDLGVTVGQGLYPVRQVELVSHRGVILDQGAGHLDPVISPLHEGFLGAYQVWGLAYPDHFHLFLAELHVHLHSVSQEHNQVALSAVILLDLQNGEDVALGKSGPETVNFSEQFVFLDLPDAVEI